MFYVIFDQFYFHEKVAWCHHKTYSMLGNHIYTSYIICMHSSASLLTYKKSSSLLTKEGFHLRIL